MGAHYTGLDFSDRMVAAARSTIGDLLEEGKATLGVGEITRLQLAEDSFDAVVAMGLFEYLTRDQVNLALREMTRVLRPGGIAVITIPKRWNWGKLVLGALSPVKKIIRWRPYSREVKLNRQEEFRRLYLTPEELDQACAEADFSKAGARHYNFQFVCRPATLVAPRLCYLLNRPWEFLANLPLGSFFATGYIGMYRKRSSLAAQE